MTPLPVRQKSVTVHPFV